MEFPHLMIIAGAVLVVLGIVALHLATTPPNAPCRQRKTARASGCAGRARIGGRLSAGPEQEPPRMRAVRLHPRQRRLASIG